MGKPDQLRRRGRSKDKKQGGSSDGLSVKDGAAVSNLKGPLIHLSEEARTWHEYGQDLPGRNDTIAILNHKERKFMTPELIRRFRSQADSIYQNELRLFGQSPDRKASSDDRWVENTMRKGTLKDRIAAMSVTVSSDPIHKFYALDGLLSMVGCSADGGHGSKPNSRVAQLAGEALEDIFVNTLLPSNRKLVTMGQRPLCRYDDNNNSSDNKGETKNGFKPKKQSHKTLSPRILLLWRFEEMVKEKYDLFLRQYMAQTLQDGVEQQKIGTLQSAANLLCSVPEGEAKLLDMMVNKLGDPDKKTAAAAGHQLRMVLQQHPNMQTVIAREVQQLAHRPHLSPKALYNCIVFLNQLQLKRPEVEAGIIDHDEGNGIKRSMGESSSLPASLIKTYFRLFEVAVQQSEKQSKKSKSLSDEAGAMKGRLLSALLTGVNRAHPYLPEKDQDMEEHIDALYRIVHKAPPGACTQALMLLFHLAVGFQLEQEQQQDGKDSHDKDRKSKPDEGGEEHRKRQDRFYRALYATLAKSSVVCRGKHLTMYFNLLYKAMKYDSDINRVHAFAKRLLAAVLHAPPPTMAATMFLLQEISKTHEDLRLSWEDVPDPDSNATLVLDDTKREPKAGIVTMAQLMAEGAGAEKETSTTTLGPPPCWELTLLSHHFHPSVNKFANDIGEIDYAGDPLHDFGLAPFLDKFAYRNPKSREKLLQQYKQAGGTTGAGLQGRRMKRLQGRLEIPVNDPRFLEKNDVNEQEEFFHRFFVERARRDEIKGITRSSAENSKSNDDESDDEITDAQEQQALDAAEEADADVGVQAFEEYEAMWETDEEEEEFVDSLALKLLEDSAGGPADIDDDPDMEDWGDMYDDEDNDDGEGEEHHHDGNDGSKHDDSESPDEAKGDEDDDTRNESDSDNSDSEPEIDESDIVGGLDVEPLDQNGLGQDEDGSESDSGGDISEDDESDVDDEFILSLVAEESDHDDEQDETPPQKNGRKNTKAKSKKQEALPTFADADEYFEKIERSFQELKRSAPPSAAEEEEENVKPSKKSKKRRKR
jgi:ribosome biogenesis protein MAK21